MTKAKQTFLKISKEYKRVCKWFRDDSRIKAEKNYKYNKIKERSERQKNKIEELKKLQTHNRNKAESERNRKKTYIQSQTNHLQKIEIKDIKMQKRNNHNK